MISSSYQKEDLNIFAIGCWFLWNDRNNYIQGKSVPFFTSKVEWILKYYNSYIQATKDEVRGRGTVSQNSLSSTQRWSKPPLGFLKLNVDATWKEDPALTGLGVVLRDSDGSLLGSFAQALDVDFVPYLQNYWRLKKLFVGLCLRIPPT